MNEDFLHYIWKFQRFNKKNLKLTSGESIEIIQPGILNTDSGPDFFNGQIKLNSTKWAGNVEIHKHSSDWLKHKHQDDLAYDKVILHVVWIDDTPIKRLSGEVIPCIELKGLVSKVLLEQYDQLQKEFTLIPCESSIKSVDSFIIETFIERLAFERLEHKSQRLNQLLKLNKNDWESTLYQMLAKYFGFKVNAIPFELLAQSLPYSIIRKHVGNLFQLEALLFGQAGLLEGDFKGNYPRDLQQGYHYLKAKYRLKAIEPSLWKFMRMRPVNFPSIRIAQFAALLNEKKALFESIVNENEVQQLEKTFSVSASAYWDSHFRFDKPAANKRSKKLGVLAINTLLINSIIPLIFNYAKQKGDGELSERALFFLTQFKPEKNKITRLWSHFNIQADNAQQSQALIELKTNYCDLKKCLNCSIGNSILK